MRSGQRQALTLALGGLLVVGGGTVGPRATTSAGPDAAVSLPAGPTASVPSIARSPRRVLGVLWRGKPGAESAELAWLGTLTLRPRAGRRLALGQHGVDWAVAPDQSLALLAGGGDGNDGKLLVVDPRRLRRLGAIRLSRWWEWPYASRWLGRSRMVLAGDGPVARPPPAPAAGRLLRPADRLVASWYRLGARPDE